MYTKIKIIMNAEHIKYLCCPQTGKDLILNITEESLDSDIITDSLLTEDGLYSYLIIRSIPHFVGNQYYSNSFDYEWNQFPRVQFEDENIEKPMEGHTTRMFHTITGFIPVEMSGKKYVEFGCGPGRFLDIVRKNGGIGVGIDLSNAVDAAQKNLGDDPNVLIVQGDIFSPPFRQNFFDGGYSIGVLHHTPDPERGLKSLCSVIKPGGKIACCVYPKIGLYALRSTNILRSIMVSVRHIFGENIGYRVAMLYSKVSGILFFPVITFFHRIPYIGQRIARLIFENLCVVVFVPDRNWRILDTFDAITPEYASTHTAEEVEGWLTRAGCENLRQSAWGETSWQAEKSSKPCVE